MERVVAVEYLLSSSIWSDLDMKMRQVVEVSEECCCHLDVFWPAIEDGRKNLPTFLFQGNPCLESSQGR